jgi:hypothetical protein
MFKHRLKIDVIFELISKVILILISFVYISDKLVELREAYLAADEAGRRELEQRYGRRNLQRAVEESYSQQWVQDNCKKCPQCQTQIEVSLP